MRDEELIEEARDLLDEGQPEEAIELLEGVDEEALEEELRVDYVLVQAEALTMVGRHEEALAHHAHSVPIRHIQECPHVLHEQRS